MTEYDDDQPQVINYISRELRREQLLGFAGFKVLRHLSRSCLWYERFLFVEWPAIYFQARHRSGCFFHNNDVEQRKKIQTIPSALTAAIRTYISACLSCVT